MDEHGPTLGIDAGERRVGLAISDPEQRLAVPLTSVEQSGAIDRIAGIVAEQGVGEVVVGLPLSLSGEPSAQTQRARNFASRLETRLGLTVRLWDERLSTREATRVAHGGSEGRSRGRRRGRSTADTDAIAASIILQAYLDHRRFALDT